MISDQQIIDKLDSIHEHTMAKKIFVPIFKRMGLKGARFTGGSAEEGVDVEYYELTQPEEHRSYVGIQFKKGNLTYSGTAGKGSVNAVKNQAQAAFEKELFDPEIKHGYHISRFVVACTGDINDNARTFLKKQKDRGEQRNVGFWAQDTLVSYVRTYGLDIFKEYFGIKDGDFIETTESEDMIVDVDFIKEEMSELISHADRLSKTVSGYEWSILLTLVKYFAENGSQCMGVNDLLFELGCREDYIRDEVQNLSGTLGYLDLSDGGISLAGKASELYTLVDRVRGELEDAGESEESAWTLIEEIIG